MNSNRLLIGLVLIVGLLGPERPSKAAEPPAVDVPEANARHAQARSLADNALQEQDPERRAELMERAIELWEEAEQLNPTWRFAYNLARAYLERKAFLEAWRACRRARARSVPRRELRDLNRLERVAEKALLKDRALIELSVDPPDAEVTLNDEAWGAAGERWVDRGESTLSVSRDGFVSQEQTWTHPIGRKTSLRIRLRPTPVDESDPTTVGVSRPTAPLSFGAWKPGLLIGGLVGVAGGLGLLIYRDQLAKDQEEVNGEVRVKVRLGSDYSNEYQANEEHHALVKGVGIGLTVVGALAAIAGGVLYTLEPDGTPGIAIAPLIDPVGSGLVIEGRF